MVIVLSGGGTAGHINPALAVAELLVKAGHEVHFAGCPVGIEARLVPEAGLPFEPFEAAGFNRNHPASLIKALRLMSKSTKKAIAWFDRIKPDVVVGFGGYVCMSVGRAAEKKGIPVVLHEQNSVMGLTNKYLAGKAARVALTYEVAGQALSDKSRLVLTGNPVRSSVFSATREEGRDYMGIDDDQLVLVVFGGSLGARHINTAVSALAKELLEHPKLHVWHITGPKEYETVHEQLGLDSAQAARYHLVGYENQMGKVLAGCDMVVARSGATSLAEISALRIPALLVPFPFATADHQTTNAREFVRAGAACMVPDSEVEGPRFREELLRMVESSEVRESMRKAAEGFDTRDAAEKLSEVILQVAAAR